MTKEANQKAAGKPVAFLNPLKKTSNTASKRLRSKRLSDKSFIILTDFEQKTLIRLNDFPYFKVGGRDKSFEQIADLPNSYILADGIEHPIGKKLSCRSWVITK